VSLTMLCYLARNLIFTLCYLLGWFLRWKSNSLAGDTTIPWPIRARLVESQCSACEGQIRSRRYVVPSRLPALFCYCSESVLT